MHCKQQQLMNSNSTVSYSTAIVSHRHPFLSPDGKRRVRFDYLLTQRYLTLSGFFVPVESTFSTTGLTLNTKRMSLGPCKLIYCTFIHDIHDNAHTASGQNPPGQNLLGQNPLGVGQNPTSVVSEKKTKEKQNSLKQ